MESAKRMVNLAFAGGTILAWVLLTKLFATVFGSLGVRDAHLLGKNFTTSTALAAGAAIGLLVYCWRHERVRPMSQEVADELVQVTWPSWDETKSNTRITIVVTLIISFILWVFDQAFGNLTNLLLGGS